MCGLLSGVWNYIMIDYWIEYFVIKYPHRTPQVCLTDRQINTKCSVKDIKEYLETNKICINCQQDFWKEGKVLLNSRSNIMLFLTRPLSSLGGFALHLPPPSPQSLSPCAMKHLGLWYKLFLGVFKFLAASRISLSNCNSFLASNAYAFSFFFFFLQPSLLPPFL